tara:strand:- start:52 stop:243 length:192 start_codon:yes stop_codon:yes gene_type:complete
MDELTDEDVKWCRKVCRELFSQLSQGGDSGPEVVMTSLGYVECWADGSVVFFGKTIAQIDMDD